MAEDTAGADIVAAAKHLPLLERVVHKQWRVREDAYKQLTTKFNSAAEDSKIYPDFAGLLSKFVRDANAPAQLLAFDAVGAFADRAPPPLVRNVAAAVGKGIADKGLTGRPTNTKRAAEAALMFVGADAGEPVVEAIVATGFAHRTPKVVATAVELVRRAIETYGGKAVPVKPIAAALGALLTHSNEPVRKAAKALLIELHRWVGDAVRSVAKAAPDVTVKELDAAFEANKQMEKPKALKLTRAMEERVREAPEGADGDDGDDPFAADGPEEEELDLAEEIDLLPLLPKMKINVEGEDEPVKDWYAAVESKKWRVRKDSLEFAVNSVGEARLTPGAYGDVIVRLRKVIAKDANVNCVAAGAKLVAAIANGLRKNFNQAAGKALTVDLLGRLKEKNKVAVIPLEAALDALHLSRAIRIAELLDEVSAAAANKVPKARAGLFLWLDRCFKAGTPASELKDAPLKTFGNILVAATDDSSPDVRDGAMAALASLHVLVGERNMNPYMQKLDKHRNEKVLSIAKDLPPPKRMASAAARAAGPASSGKSVKPAKRAVARESGSTSSGPVTRASAKAAKAPPKKAKPAAPLVSDDEGEVDVPVDDALTRAAARFEGFDTEQWAVKSFKARVAAVGVVSAALGEGETVEFADAALVLALLGVAPGVSDSNFMALKAKLELLGLVVEKCQQPLPRKTLKGLLELVVDKLGDIKCAITATGIFMSVAEATSARFFFEILAKGAIETNNGRAKVGMAKFAKSMVTDFGCPAVPVKTGVNLVVSLLSAEPPAALRSAVLALAAALACRAEPKDAVRKGMEDSGKIDGAMLELFDAELGKHSGEPDAPCRKKRFNPVSAEPVEEIPPEISPAPSVPDPPAVAPSPRRAPARASRAAAAAPRRAEPSAALAGGDSKAPPHTESNPGARTNLADHFGPGSQILGGLKHANWKTRQEALASIDSLISDAGGCVSGNVGFELMPELRKRFADSNRNIAALAYGVVGRLGSAMGQSAMTHIKVIVPHVLSAGCVDIKRTVRDAACKCLDLWFDALGLSAFVPYLHLPLTSINSSFRKEYLQWLVPRLSGEIGSFSAVQEDLSSLVDPCLSCLQDRVAEVRQLGEFALESIVASVGYSVVEGKVQNLGKTARLRLEPVISKFRGPGASAAVPVARSNAPSPRPGAGRTGGGLSGRSSVRERPRSVAVPPSPRLGPRRNAGHDEASTPRGGLRRVRPSSVRAVPVQEAAPAPEVNEPVLKGGSGRVVRSQRILEAKPLPGHDSVHGIVPFVPEQSSVLAADIKECVSSSLFVKLTAPANRFQQHVEAIEEMSVAFREDPDTLVECADVLLRWAAFRIDDVRTPPTMQVKAAQFITCVCEVLISSGSVFNECEASAVVPVVVDKCGSNRPAVQDALLASLLSIGDVMDSGKLMGYMAEGMWRTTNTKSKVQAATAMANVIDRVCGNETGEPPHGSLSLIAKIAYGPDDAAGRGAAALIERVHQHIGDDVWAMVGEVTDEQAEMLESRFPQVSGGNGPEEAPSPRGFSEPAHAAQAAPAAHGMPSQSPYSPSSIRAEDFRLSVAPAPPSNVMSAIGESMHTPRRNPKSEAKPTVGQTPSLPSRRARGGGTGNFSFISSQKDSYVQSVTDLLSSDLRSEQEQGLNNLFDSLAEPQSPLLYDCASEILPLISRDFRDCVERLEEGNADSHEQSILKQFLNALNAYVSAPSVIRGVDQATIEQLLCDVVDAMIPNEMPAVDDWNRIRRGVNLAVLKILETCDRNLLYTALFNLLLVEMRIENDGDDKLLAKSQLLIKSVAKVAKRGFADVKIDVLFRDMNYFVTSLMPSYGWGSSLADEDEAIALIRTVLESVVKERGASVDDEMSLIPASETSPIFKYVSGLLSLSTAGREADRDESVRSAVSVSAQGGRMAVRREADETDPHDKLTQIFEQMLSSGGREAGLRRLRAFMVCYPDYDINPHISKCSQAFQDYIRQGLDSFSSESVDVQLKSSTRSAISITDAGGQNTSPPLSSSSSESSGQAYLKRLREIQLKYGLPEVRKDADGGAPLTGSSWNSGSEDGADKIGHEAVEKENGDIGSYSVAETRDKATALRERMARIREASKD